MRSPGIKDRVPEVIEKISEVEEKLKGLQIQLLATESEILDFMNSIDDSILRQIIYCRFVRLMSWERTALEIGGGNTADACRQAVRRYLKKMNIE